MGLIKKADVKAYFAARRASRAVAKEKESKQVNVISSKEEPAVARVTSAEFLRDFCLEHSSLKHSRQVTFAPLVVGSPGSTQVAIAARNLHA